MTEEVRQMFARRRKRLDAANVDFQVEGDFGIVVANPDNPEELIVKVQTTDDKVLWITMTQGEYYNMVQTGNDVLGLTLTGNAARFADFYGMGI
jgi:hypothetical protein